ncbi:MAG: hypothetical protein Q4C98_02610 [Capnocytophaga sp.]|nr:hypothetical protein [Capnocytophaga sp.]
MSVKKKILIFITILASGQLVALLFSWFWNENFFPHLFVSSFVIWLIIVRDMRKKQKVKN